MNAISAIHSQALYQRPSFAQPVQAKEAQGGESTNPAQSARAAVAGRPDLADKPFGSLVSLFAKGLPLPPFENAEDVAPAGPEQNTGTPLSGAAPVMA